MKGNIENSIKESLGNFEMPYDAGAWAKMSDQLDANAASGSSGAESAAYGAGIGAAIKQGLDSFEAPYNPAAWNALEAKLDAKTPVAPKSNLKWFLGAAAIVALITVGYFLSANGENEVLETTSSPATAQHTESSSNPSDQSAANNAATNNQGTNVIDADSDETTSNTNSSDDNTSNSASDLPINGSDVSENNNGNNSSSSNSDNPDNGSSNVNNGNNASNDGSEDQTSNNASGALIIAPIDDVCQGTIVKVKNVNEVPLVVLGPDMTFIIPANQTRNIRMKSAGNYKVTSLDDQTRKAETFNVKSAPLADFTIDTYTKFERGIPVTNVETTAPGVDYTWVYDGQMISGNTAQAHFYTKGNHDITLTVHGGNGCKQSVTKSIYVEDNYNLMAENAFRPNSTDPSVNSFMPYALEQRDIPFTMVIIDPRDGHVVYETNDASQGWDGIDIRSGQLVSFETSYIWKVTIERRALNEKRNEYSGQIIPVHSYK